MPSSPASENARATALPTLRVPNGYVLRPGVDLLVFTDMLRAVCGPLARNLDARALASSATSSLDTALLAGTAVSPWPLRTAWRDLQTQWLRGEGDPELHQFDVTFHRDPATGRVLLRAWADSPEYADALAELPTVDAYDLAVAPGALSLEQWRERHQVWTRTLSAPAALTFTLRDDVRAEVDRFVQDATFEGPARACLAAAFPSRIDRARVLIARELAAAAAAAGLGSTAVLRALAGATAETHLQAVAGRLVSGSVLLEIVGSPHLVRSLPDLSEAAAAVRDAVAALLPAGASAVWGLQGRAGGRVHLMAPSAGVDDRARCGQRLKNPVTVPLADAAICGRCTSSRAATTRTRTPSARPPELAPSPVPRAGNVEVTTPPALDTFPQSRTVAVGVRPTAPPTLGFSALDSTVAVGVRGSRADKATSVPAAVELLTSKTAASCVSSTTAAPPHPAGGPEGRHNKGGVSPEGRTGLVRAVAARRGVRRARRAAAVSGVVLACLLGSSYADPAATATGPSSPVTAATTAGLVLG